MSPINVEVSRSNVKVTVAFYAKTFSAKYLEKFLSVTVMVLSSKIAHSQ